MSVVPVSLKASVTKRVRSLIVSTSVVPVSLKESVTKRVRSVSVSTKVVVVWCSVEVSTSPRSPRDSSSSVLIRETVSAMPLVCSDTPSMSALAFSDMRSLILPPSIASVSDTIWPVTWIRSATSDPTSVNDFRISLVDRSISAVTSAPFEASDDVSRSDASSTVSKIFCRVVSRSPESVACEDSSSERTRSELLTIASRWLTSSSIRLRTFNSFSE